MARVVFAMVMIMGLISCNVPIQIEWDNANAGDVSSDTVSEKDTVKPSFKEGEELYPVNVQFVQDVGDEYPYLVVKFPIGEDDPVVVLGVYLWIETQEPIDYQSLEVVIGEEGGEQKRCERVFSHLFWCEVGASSPSSSWIPVNIKDWKYLSSPADAFFNDWHRLEVWMSALPVVEGHPLPYRDETDNPYRTENTHFLSIDGEGNLNMRDSKFFHTSYSKE